MLQTFHFLRPEWLIAIPVIAIFLILFARRSIQNTGWEKVCDPALLQYQLAQQNEYVTQPTRLLHWIIPIVFLMTIIALAGPSWEKKEQPIFQQGNALVIILDLSLSMNAEDIKPSRLERAKLKIVDILKQKKEGQSALIAFAGDAHTVSPLTIDNKTIMSLLPALDSSIMPLSGSHIVDALITAKQLLINSGFSQGDILLISDGIDQSQKSKLEDSVKSLYKQGYRFSVIGVGSRAGSPIPLPEQGGFVKDATGQVVLSKLSEEPLEHLTQIGGGMYHQLSLNNSDFKTLLDKRLLDIDAIMAQDNQLEQWVDEGAYITWLLIPLALMAFRKGLMSIVFMLLIVSPFIPEPALAIEIDKSHIIDKWRNLWSTSDQQGQQAFQAQDFDQAADKFTDKNWKASAYYRSGDFAKAVEHFEPFQDANSLYNKANALANLKKFQEAIDTYDETLKIVPQMDDAIKNRDYLKQLLSQQKQQQSQQNSDQTQQEDSDKQSKEQDQQQQNSAQDGSQSNDSESSQSQQNNNGTEDSDANTAGSEQAATQSNESQEKDPAENNKPLEPDANNNIPQQSGQQTESDKAQEIEPSSNENSSEQQAMSGQQQEENNQEGSDSSTTNDVLSQLSQEEQQSLKQWLQRIPDNPGNLLRIKFRNNSLLKQRQQQAPAQYEGSPW